ncbi:MAG: alpha/beta hydrolase [Gammaproteobacteria bacterium]|nr:alpha/beta hydrolase [Gammaproteobacteria bacterium]NNM11590.1 alpha/beta hydrolase [Pseudomonadales bacterium]
MNVVELKKQLRPLELDGAYSHSEQEKGYFDFYDINFSKKLDRVKHHLGYIKCNDYRIACHYFENAGAERTCFVVHGFMDHVGLFRKVIEYLLHRGCNVVMFEFPGHGLSSGKPASIDSFGDYVLVLRQVLEFFYKKVDTPWHVVAQSMGAAVVMDYLLSQQYDEDTGPFDKVLLLAPLVRPKKWRRARIGARVLRGWMPSIRRTFAINSHDKEFLRFVRTQDPLVIKRIPIKWITAMINWGRRFKELSWGENVLLVVQGDEDDTVDWRYNQKKIAEKFPKSRFMPIKGARHHLAHESDEYFQRVVQAADIYFERRSTPR